MLPPVERRGEEAEVGFLHRIASALGARQQQDLFLDVAGQIQERHDLHHARRRDLADASQLGLVAATPSLINRSQRIALAINLPVREK